MRKPVEITIDLASDFEPRLPKQQHDRGPHLEDAYQNTPLWHGCIDLSACRDRSDQLSEPESDEVTKNTDDQSQCRISDVNPAEGHASKHARTTGRGSSASCRRCSRC